MAALLVSLSVMGLMMSMALPVWSHAAKREREAELIFRGEQYARAIVLYQRRVAGGVSRRHRHVGRAALPAAAVHGPDDRGRRVPAHLPGPGLPDAGRPGHRRHAGTADGPRGPARPIRERPGGRVWAGGAWRWQHTGWRAGGHHRRRQQEHRGVNPALQRPWQLQRVGLHPPWRRPRSRAPCPVVARPGRASLVSCFSSLARTASGGSASEVAGRTEGASAATPAVRDLEPGVRTGRLASPVPRCRPVRRSVHRRNRGASKGLLAFYAGAEHQ